MLKRIFLLSLLAFSTVAFAQATATYKNTAARFQMSLNAVSKHIKVLEGAGLVSRRTLWREHLIEVRMEPLALVDLWFRDLRSIWDLRLEALDHLLTKETKND